MTSRSKKDHINDLLQRYEITELYTNIETPLWEVNEKIYGLAVSNQFHSINRFVSFIRDLTFLCSDFIIKPIALNLYSDGDFEINKIISMEHLFHCYTADKGWLYETQQIKKGQVVT